MNITVNRNEFLKALNLVQVTMGAENYFKSPGIEDGGIIIDHSNVSELKTRSKVIKISTGENCIRIGVLSPNVSINVAIEHIKIKEQGSILFHGESLEKIIQLYINPEITIYTTGENVRIQSGKESGEYSLVDIIDYNEYEHDLNTHIDNWITLPKNIFLFAHSKVSFAASKDSESRQKMQSIYFNMRNNNLDIVACDGLILTKYIMSYTKPTQDFRLLINVHYLLKIYKVMRLIKTDSVNVFITKEKLFIKSDNSIMFFRLFESTYINYNKILPNIDNRLFRIGFNKNKLLHIFDKFSKENHVVIIEFSDRNYMNIINAEKKIARIAVTIKEGNINSCYSIKLNYKTFSRALNAIKDTAVCLDFFTPHEPVVLQNTFEHNYIIAIIPLTTKPT